MFYIRLPANNSLHQPRSRHVFSQCVIVSLMMQETKSRCRAVANKKHWSTTTYDIFNLVHRIRTPLIVDHDNRISHASDHFINLMTECYSEQQAQVNDDPWHIHPRAMHPYSVAYWSRQPDLQWKPSIYRPDDRKKGAILRGGWSKENTLPRFPFHTRSLVQYFRTLLILHRGESDVKAAFDLRRPDPRWWGAVN